MNCAGNPGWGGERGASEGRAALADERVYYHVVLTVTFAKPVFLVPEVDAAFKEAARAISRRQGWNLMEIETMPNHVHLLIEKAPWEDLRQILKVFKAFTARRLFAQFPWLREDLASLHFWTPGHHYERHTDASLATVRAYIRNQCCAVGLEE